jgi:hypothetical protein
MNKEDIEDKIKSLMRKRSELILEINKLQDELISLTENLYEYSDDMVKVKCINCEGIGYMKDGDKKKLCQLCNGKHYNWLQKWDVPKRKPKSEED